ncbi:glycosyltransferase [Parvibaculum sp.]|uniref:glycosyltransferase n=1 Tax=Parvibaculum sp. TaxID=2024848 RepID=UPI001B1B8B69|nr:glycosyltransferase [Parvibaculum sp.]MBO6669223.1 glycosyltransferase [Parvibaculum sp.]MBO6693157.1 glycosyltransferase [Parvibaculum sp.]MBO6713011.1 glycosyltransferase [Parvibaculum sp.]
MAAATGSRSVRRVVHVMRLPMGGLFRHVRDLVAGQQEAGIAVGVICADAPDERAAAALAKLGTQCGLGLHVVPMSRLPGFGDISNIREVSRLIAWLKPDIVHGHGAKGGMLARLSAGAPDAIRVYTPHGGSLHYGAASLEGMVYLGAERLMRQRTDGLIFESDFSRNAYRAKVGKPAAPTVVIHNGLSDAEFEPVVTEKDAADFLFIGELRMLKGVSTLIEAASLLPQPVSIRIVGAGPDRAAFERMACEKAGKARIEFMGAMPAREAFSLARMVVMPSWNESLPYVALEAGGAGKPLIATKVGGVPEIFGPLSSRLVPPGDAPALAGAMSRMLSDPASAEADAASLRARVREFFSVSRMVESVDGFYARLLDTREQRREEARAGRDAAAARAGLTGAER